MHAKSAIQQYNEELALAHREAIAALRELLSTEKDPTERRRLAIAMLRARPIKDPAAQPQPKAARTPSKRKIESLEELQAITTILETDPGALERLFTAYTSQTAPELPHRQPTAEPAPPTPIAKPRLERDAARTQSGGRRIGVLYMTRKLTQDEGRATRAG